MRRVWDDARSVFSLVLLQGGVGSYSQGCSRRSCIVHPGPRDGGGRRTRDRQVSGGSGDGGDGGDGGGCGGDGEDDDDDDAAADDDHAGDDSGRV